MLYVAFFLVVSAMTMGVLATMLFVIATMTMTVLAIVLVMVFLVVMPIVTMAVAMTVTVVIMVAMMLVMKYPVQRNKGRHRTDYIVSVMCTGRCTGQTEHEQSGGKPCS